MKLSCFAIRMRAIRIGAALTGLTALLSVQPVAAVDLNVYVSTIQQYGAGSSAFYLGHTVLAHTIFSTLNAGGTYSAQCANAATLPVTGERALSTYSLGGNSLTVTVPANQPALANMTGWSQVSPGAILACNYRWTAFATEGGFSIGAGGITYPIGSGTERLGGTVDFTMFRQGTNGTGGGCSP